jgi:hypothetical protein
MPYFDANPPQSPRRRMAALGFRRLAGPFAGPLGDITSDLQSVDWGTVGLVGIGILLFVGVARRGSDAIRAAAAARRQRKISKYKARIKALEAKG